jgi:hypothetical protein
MNGTHSPWVTVRVDLRSLGNLLPRPDEWYDGEREWEQVLDWTFELFQKFIPLRELSEDEASNTTVYTLISGSTEWLMLLIKHIGTNKLVKLLGSVEFDESQLDELAKELRGPFFERLERSIPTIAELAAKLEPAVRQSGGLLNEEGRISLLNEFTGLPAEPFSESARKLLQDTARSYGIEHCSVDDDMIVSYFRAFANSPHACLDSEQAPPDAFQEGLAKHVEARGFVTLDEIRELRELDRRERADRLRKDGVYLSSPIPGASTSSRERRQWRPLYPETLPASRYD